MSLCVADIHCRDYDQTAKQAATVDGPTPLCPLCLTRAVHAIPLLVRDYADLEQHLPPTLGVWGDGQPGHAGEAPIPLRLGVEALQRDIWWLTTAWAEVLADRHRLAPMPTRVRGGYATNWAVGILTPRVESLARLGVREMWTYPHTETTVTHISGAQGVLDLVRAHDRARRVLGLNTDTRTLPGYCGSKACGRPGLRQDNGSDTVYCSWCGSRQTREDYERYGNLFLRPKENAA